ncbi:chromosome partitioning protein ParB [bacterium 1XD42-94]|nr:chromosome partitioning protein ParB [bacterium 1XD42-76]NBK04853.1 chromosome partitioning protein ParB [bacterium 1XD42-94]
MRVLIREIRIREGRRRLDDSNVKELAESIQELGLLNPITIDRNHVLIAGFHRLEAVRILGWEEVECTVSSLDGLEAELAEIDENFIRKNLPPIEYGEMLLRRKEIYEMLHPETKATYKGGKFRGNQHREVVADKMSATTKSFVKDTAEKLGVAPRTVRRQIQTAKNLAPEAKEIIKEADTKISRKATMKISYLEPERQKEAALLLAAGEIRTVDEYTAKENPEEKKQEPKNPASLKEVVAELKDPDKDCSGTPDSFLEEYSAFVRKFHKEISWYSDPYYDTVFPHVSMEQLASLRELTRSICSAAEELFQKVERTMKI